MSGTSLRSPGYQARAATPAASSTAWLYSLGNMLNGQGRRAPAGLVGTARFRVNQVGVDQLGGRVIPIDCQTPALLVVSADNSMGKSTCVRSIRQATIRW